MLRHKDDSERELSGFFELFERFWTNSKTYYTFFWKYAHLSDNANRICVFVSHFLVALFDIKIEFLVFNGLNEPMLVENISFLIDSISNGYRFYSKLEETTEERQDVIRALTHKLDCGTPLTKEEVFLLKDHSINFKKYSGNSAQKSVVNLLKCIKRLMDLGERHIVNHFVEMKVPEKLLAIFKQQFTQNRIFIETKIEDLKLLEVD